MAVTIGHARKGETSNVAIKGGKAGDQTGGEVAITEWYLHSKGWVVLRCKDNAKRERIALAMEKACKNNAIGYDQYQRDTLFNDVKNKGFDPSKTTKNVETDCSALVRVCIAYAYGKDVVGNIRTVTEPNTLVKTGLFEKLTSSVYCKSSDYLKRGDILCTPTSGHTVVVLKNGAKVKHVTTQTNDKLVVDGDWGIDTTKTTQKVLGTPIDGIVSKQPKSNKKYLPNCMTNSWKFVTIYKGGSQMIKAIQKLVEAKVDGYCGKQTVIAIQKFLKLKGYYNGVIDGIMGVLTVKAWQSYINSRI